MARCTCINNAVSSFAEEKFLRFPHFHGSWKSRGSFLPSCCSSSREQWPFFNSVFRTMGVVWCARLMLRQRAFGWSLYGRFMGFSRSSHFRMIAVVVVRFFFWKKKRIWWSLRISNEIECVFYWNNSNACMNRISRCSFVLWWN